MSLQEKPASSRTMSDASSTKTVGKLKGDQDEPVATPRDTPLVACVQRTQGAMGDAVLRFLKIRKGGPKYDPGAVSVVSPIGSAVPLLTARSLPSPVSGTRTQPKSIKSSTSIQNGRISKRSILGFGGQSGRNGRQCARWT